MSSEGAWLSPDVVAAVARHMNDDHAEDNVVICRGVGGHPTTTSASFVGLDTTEATFLAVTPDGDFDIRVPFAQPVHDRSDVRVAVAELFHRSAALLGMPERA